MSILTNIKKIPNLLFNKVKIAFDFGSSNTRIAIFSKGIIVREPTVIAINGKTNEILFIGDEAKEILGKSPEYIKVIKPIKHGLISDFDNFVNLVSFFLENSIVHYLPQKSLFKPQMEAYITIPASATEVDQKALIDGFVKSGFINAYIIEKPIANAFGLSHPISSNKPIFIADLGGGTVEIAVISLGGIITHKIYNQGGEHLDNLIINYLHLKYGLLIGQNTAEALKIKLLSFENTPEKILTVRGKSLENHMPKSVKVKSSDIRESLASYFNHLIDIIKDVIEACPPEIINEIVSDGIVITGGLAHIKGINSFFSTELKIPVKIAENPFNTTINGILALLNNPNQFQYFINKTP